MVGYTFDIHGVPSDTDRVAVLDTPQEFEAARFTRNQKSAIALLITCETNNVRFCLGGSIPTQGAAGLGHILYVGQSLRLTNPAQFRSFTFINHTLGAAAFLQITAEFPVGA